MIHKEIGVDTKKIVIETGELAKQSNSAIVVKLGETTVLVTVVIRKEKNAERQDGVLPLTVDYRERTYAIGKIPGGFFKREGRPKEREIHISRMIDRSIRPLFPKGFNYPVQVTVIVLSSDGENAPDIPALIGVSCALVISDIPFNIPIACLRVLKSNDKFIINPTYDECTTGSMELIIAGTEKEIAMIELQANEIDEKVIVDAIRHCQETLQKIIQIQSELKDEIGQPKFSIEKVENSEVISLIEPLVKDKLSEIIRIEDKEERKKIHDELVENILANEKFIDQETKEPKLTESEIKNAIEKISRDQIRNYVFQTNTRPDGRKFDEIRLIDCSVRVLPRTHGVALFTRGQTQALVTVTLGTPHDMQVMEELGGEYKERFLFHYNFPGFATGDIKPDRGPSRREIGHGLLAKRSIYPVLPNENDFPYTIRVVSDILESNGSSSMASVCGASLALCDAGVSVKSNIAGVAMGLLKNEEKCIILTDISGLEDHIGDMDFKVAGTVNGVTGIQLDVKIPGIDLEIINQILKQAKEARLKILEKMNSVIDKPRKEISEYAPRLLVLQIPQEKIGELIGPGGKNIRQIIEETKTEIDVEEGGRVFVSGKDAQSVKLAQEMIEYYTANIELGKVYQGKVTRITDFGAFVEILPGKEGLVHISQLANYRVQKVRDIVKEGNEISVKVIDIDEKGRIVLSHKATLK